MKKSRNAAILQHPKSPRDSMEFQLLTGELAGDVFGVMERLELLLTLIDRGDSGDDVTLSFMACNGLCTILRDQIGALGQVEEALSSM